MKQACNLSHSTAGVFTPAFLMRFVFAVLISDPALLEIGDPVIQFLNNSGPPYKATFQTANVGNEQVLLRNAIAEAIETQFLSYIRNQYSEHLYK